MLRSYSLNVKNSCFISNHNCSLTFCLHVKEIIHAFCHLQNESRHRLVHCFNMAIMPETVPDLNTQSSN